MHPNEALIRALYDAFDRGDGDAMAACYHGEATFSDPVFNGLDAAQTGAMWRMLTSQAADLRVTHSDVQADSGQGRAHWEAWYTFSATGRKVHNVIEARFQFRDNAIVGHVDAFPFWPWSRQALGLAGLALGWTPLLKWVVRRQAMKGLAEFQAKH